MPGDKECDDLEANVLVIKLFTCLWIFRTQHPCQQICFPLITALLSVGNQFVHQCKHFLYITIKLFLFREHQLILNRNACTLVHCLIQGANHVKDEWMVAFTVETVETVIKST